MSFQQAVTEQAAPSAKAVPWTLVGYLAVGLMALVPRVFNLGVFLSGDESQFWIGRSGAFLRALRAHDWPATAISTHPGVTTMWLGSAGLILHHALTDWGLLLDQSFPTFVTLLRIPTALAHVAAVLLGYMLLRRMLSTAIAALAALLWAADPFVIAFSRVLHVDALAASFLTLSLLAACLYWHHERRARWLMLSGICAGLAILSKSPALALLPWVGLVTLVAAWRAPGRPQQRLLREIQPLAAWAALCALTIFALWPALGIAPIRAYQQLRLGVDAEGAQPHMLGNFFLGREDDAPGPLFYPVALALRLTPWTMLGLLLLAGVWRRARAIERRDLAALACFAVLFIAAMTLFPKKFNRYLVPIFPALDILAACGLAWAARWLGQRAAHRARTAWAARRHVPGALLGLVVLAAAINVAWWHPYEMVYFNQALGGAQVGANTFTTGWGEGLSEVANWLNQQPDITGVVTVSTMVNGLQEYLRKGAQAVGRSGPLPPAAGYVVVYVRNVQWDTPWAPFDQFYGRETPAHIVRIHGVDYAWIYRVPPPAGQLIAADFGPNIHLRGVESRGPVQRGQLLTYQMSWKTSAAPTTDYMLFAHLIGADMQRSAQADLLYPTSGWGTNRYVTTNLTVPLPPNLPAGTYRLVIGLYDPTSGQRLPLHTLLAIDPALDGPDALLLDSVTVQ
jgi:4-amino-4-deoxy-L-arabinose transferase-like glycosyltransferase